MNDTLYKMHMYERKKYYDSCILFILYMYLYIKNLIYVNIITLIN